MIRIFQVYAVSKLLYCLHTMWLNKKTAEKWWVSSKVPSFHFSYPTSVHQSYFIHATVLQRSRCKQMSAIFKLRQLAFFQSVAVLPDDDVRRRCLFPPKIFFSKACQPHGARDPPNKHRFPMVSKVYRMAVEIAEGCDMLSNLCRDAVKWRSKVHPFCFVPG